MRPGGVLLVIAGVWVLCQVLGGNALKRLGLEPGGNDGTVMDGLTVPDRGYGHVPHDAQGRPL